MLEAIHSCKEEIRNAGIIAVPGVGFDVVPTDCLAAMLKRDLPSATHLRLAFKPRYGKLSPGTTKTMFEGLPEGGRIRKDGTIIRVPPAYKVEIIPFTETLSATAVTIPWGDVATAYYSTGIPNIEVFAGVPEKQIGKMKIPGFVRWLLGRAPVQTFLKGLIASRVHGPTDDQRARDEIYLYGEAWDDAGHKVAMRLRTREPYTLTAEAAVKATLKVLDDRLAPVRPRPRWRSAQSTVWNSRAPRSAALRSPAIFCAGPVEAQGCGGTATWLPAPRPATGDVSGHAMACHRPPQVASGWKLLGQSWKSPYFVIQQVRGSSPRAGSRFPRPSPLGASSRQASDHAGGALRRVVCARRHHVRGTLHSRAGVAPGGVDRERHGIRCTYGV